MFSICRQTHPATGIEHSVSCYFFNNEESCLVTAGANIVKVFRLYAEGDSKEFNAAGQPIPPKMKLECLASYTLWGNVMSMAAVRCPSMGRDLLLLSFREAKMSVLQYDPQTNDLITLSMHYFEEDDMKNGWTTHPHIPWIRVDPEGRCAVMLLYGKKLAVLPFRKDNPAEENDPLDAKPLADTKKMYVPQPVLRSPVLASYVIVLKDLDEKLDNILDIQFLYGYYEPTMLLLYEPVRTFPGRTAVRSDTCAMAAVSVNISARVHPVIWSISALPFDCIQAVPVQKPLGGCLILAVNSLIYLNQSVPPYGVSLNSIASTTTNFPLRIQEGVCITLDGACVATMGEGKFILSLKAGQLYVLTLISDSVRSVRSFHLDRAAASVLTTCMCVIEEDFLFLGSRLGNSLLLRATERENRMLLSVEKPLEATVDLTEETDPQQDVQSKRRRLNDEVVDLTPADNIDLTAHEDELQVYGSDVRTTTRLSGYLLEVCDSLLNICPIGCASLGEAATNAGEAAGVELLACSGAGKNGALTVLRRAAHAHTLTAFHLPGCVDMWTVLGEPTEGAKETEAEHAYLILSQDDSSMILQTGQEINEVDNSGFMTSAPTVFAGNLGNNKFMVQVTQTHIRLLKNGNQIQSIQLEWIAVYASTADPYLCVLSSCGQALVLALRSSRLVPTRQSLPQRPPLIKVTVYRDLSGLFTSTDIDSVQVKGEFAVKKKEKLKKQPKAEGFSSDTVYEINDDDELLYGGDATPASMQALMAVELGAGGGGGGTGAARRLSRWWARGRPAPLYWLVCVRDTGSLEVYSLPEMRLSYLVARATAAPDILQDSLESVSLTDNNDEDLVGQQEAKQLQELAIFGLGNKGSRVLLMMRFPNELVIYQAYKYPRGNLKMRFSRMPVNFAYGYRDLETPTDKNYEVSLLKENVRRIRYFGNVAGYNGVFICGATPYFIFLTARGELRCHPMPTNQSPALTFAGFNNTNCAQGFLYFDDKDSLRICVLPTHLSYDAPWPVRKVAVRLTPHFLTYHVESKTYCLVASQPTQTTSYYRFNGEDKELHQDNKPDRFPYPLVSKFSLSLFSPVSWQLVPGSRVELPAWEHVVALATVHLHYEGTTSGLRGYIALGTNYNYGEDITSRGRIIIYDIIDVVPEPGQPLTKNKLKELYAKEQKGPVTAITHVLGYLLTAIGQKIYIWQLRDNDLIGIAFIDTSIFVHRVVAVKNLILVADVYKSVCLLRYQQKHRTLSLVARDLNNVMVYDIQFMVENSTLGLLSSEADGNLAMFMYQPQARESYGGQRLVRKADYRVGQPVHCMFRVAATSGDRHATYYTTLDGGIGYLLPLPEKPYRRLLMLQNVLNNWLRHHAGLNPRGYRTYRQARKTLTGAACRGILDGDLLARYRHLPQATRNDIAKKIGTKVEEILSDLNEIDQQTAHF